jgi:heterodisulfide reductase subunit A
MEGELGTMDRKIGSVLVVGAGVAGIQASLDLAESGFHVNLVEAKGNLMGAAANNCCKGVEECNRCMLCQVSEKAFQVITHPQITLFRRGEVVKVEGEPGHFTATIRRLPEINERGCPICDKLPLYPVSVKPDPEEIKLDVAGAIMAIGFKLFDPIALPELGYGKYKDVVTAVELEKMIHERAGLFCPSDGRIPRRIAFIQCVGSRDPKIGNPWCSAACCSFTLKESIVAKEYVRDLEPTIFFMDQRPYGKDSERYLHRAKEQFGVKYIRSGVSKIEETEGGKGLVVTYTSETGGVMTAQFDMVALSIGLECAATAKKLSREFGIDLNPYGFCWTSPFSPLETSRQGFFVCGTFGGPNDITESAMQASGAAADTLGILAEAKFSHVPQKTYPAERDVSGETPKIGVFLCQCGDHIGRTVDVASLKQYVSALPEVTFCDQRLYACSQESRDEMKKSIQAYGLNRVVIGSCSFSTHGPLFQEILKEAGLNPFLMEMVNLRDQCARVHSRDPEKATLKAKDLMRMEVAKARFLEPLHRLSKTMNPSALVVGGGITGMVSAMSLAEKGFDVHLVEKTSELGGHALKIRHTLEGGDVQTYLSDLIGKVNGNSKIHVYKNSELTAHQGRVGDYTSRIKTTSGEEKEIKHGVTIIAAGGREYKPDEFLYGQDPRVIISVELEEEIDRVSERVSESQTVVMIQCVGSRNEVRPYCSRLCCAKSVKNAIGLKNLNPKMNVYMLYRDMRTYGFRESYYQEAREKGVIFIRYDLDRMPEVRKEGDILKVSVTDLILGERLEIDADLLVLASAVLPAEDNYILAKLFRVPLNEDGFFKEAYEKLSTVDFMQEGIFVAGMARSPVSIVESIYQGKAAASRAMTFLAREALCTDGIVSTVKESVCCGCKVCEALCPYGAIAVVPEENVARVDELVCKGCGTCCGACPTGAAQLKGFKKQQMMAMVDAYLGGFA